MVLYDPNSPPETKVLVYDLIGNPPRFIETNYNTVKSNNDYDEIDLWDEEKGDLCEPRPFCPWKYRFSDKERYYHIKLWGHEEVEKWAKQGYQPLHKVLFVKSTAWKGGPGVDERILEACEESVGLTLEASMEWNRKNKKEKYQEAKDREERLRKKKLHRYS